MPGEGEARGAPGISESFAWIVHHLGDAKGRLSMSIGTLSVAVSLRWSANAPKFVLLETERPRVLHDSCIRAQWCVPLLDSFRGPPKFKHDARAILRGEDTSKSCAPDWLVDQLRHDGAPRHLSATVDARSGYSWFGQVSGEIRMSGRFLWTEGSTA